MGFDYYKSKKNPVFWEKFLDELWDCLYYWDDEDERRTMISLVHECLSTADMLTTNPEDYMI